MIKKTKQILSDFVLMLRLKVANTQLKKLGMPIYALNPHTNKIEIKDLNRSLRFNFTLGELVDMCKQLSPWQKEFFINSLKSQNNG